jgi:hypothetical protein
MAFAATNGGRLSFVVVPLDMPEVMRDVCIMEEKSSGKNKDGTPRVMHTLTRKQQKEPAGFMVYFPRGHAIRVRTKADLERYGLDKKPHIINIEGLQDPNSPLGRLIVEQDQAARAGAYADLQKAVIALATRKSGNVLMPEQVGKGK